MAETAGGALKRFEDSNVPCEQLSSAAVALLLTATDAFRLEPFSEVAGLCHLTSG